MMVKEKDAGRSESMSWMRRMMLGRYGVDQLGYALLGGYLLLYLLSRLFRSSLLSLAAMACAAWMLYRILSRQIDRRRAENDRFLAVVSPMVRRYNVTRCRRRDKDHCYFRCPNCGQQLRVPKGKGKIQITCRSCGASFEETT